MSAARLTLQVHAASGAQLDLDELETFVQTALLIGMPVGSHVYISSEYLNVVCPIGELGPVREGARS